MRESYGFFLTKWFALNYRKKDIKRYFKDWVAAFGSHHLDIIKFLKENDDVSTKTAKNNVLLDTYDIVHQEAFPVNKPIIESSEAAKAFLGNKIEKVREFVKEFEKENSGDLENDSIWKINETKLDDDVELVNRYFFIIGRDIVSEWMDDPMNY